MNFDLYYKDKQMETLKEENKKLKAQNEYLKQQITLIEGVHPAIALGVYLARAQALTEALAIQEPDVTECLNGIRESQDRIIEWMEQRGIKI